MEPSLIVIAGWVKQRACILKSQLPDDWSPSFSCCIHLLGPRNWLASRRPHGGSHCKGVRPSFLSQHKKCSIHFPVKKDLRASNPIWWRRRLIETQRQRYRDDRCVPETESQRFEKSKEESMVGCFVASYAPQLCPGNYAILLIGNIKGSHQMRDQLKILSDWKIQTFDWCSQV